MAERHTILNSRAIDTLLDQDDRVSKITDGYGDFSFGPKGFKCFSCYDPFEKQPWSLPPEEELQALSVGGAAV